MHQEYDEGYWEALYRTREGGEHVELNPVLVAETSELEPGIALDAGCGEGAGAVWLASRGWDVTAVDISSTALDRARERAELAGAEVAGRIEWLNADLTTWRPKRDHFDLISALYAHTAKPLEEQVAGLATGVAPGGTLLIVGHGPSEPEHTSAPHVRFTADQIVHALGTDQWDVRVAETRPRPVIRHNGEEITLHDAVMRAVRRPAGDPRLR